MSLSNSSLLDNHQKYVCKYVKISIELCSYHTDPMVWLDGARPPPKVFDQIEFDELTSKQKF
jgi:hypothetical protein